MSILVGVQANGLAALARDLQSFAPKAAQEMMASLSIAGNLVAAEAKSEASWSSRIPGSIKVTGKTVRSIAVKAGNVADAPHAYTFEAPNGAPVRHPVFGRRDNWVEQAPRPFLRPALDNHTEEIMEIVLTSIDRALLRSGFR